ncbi:MAG TPA: hypothetical protein VIX19_03385, partial [Terriglobales bacterium]
PPYSHITAYDLNTGTIEKKIRAYDNDTGRVLWTGRCPMARKVCLSTRCGPPLISSFGPL